MRMRDFLMKKSLLLAFALAGLAPLPLWGTIFTWEQIQLFPYWGPYEGKYNWTKTPTGRGYPNSSADHALILGAKTVPYQEIIGNDVFTVGNINVTLGTATEKEKDKYPLNILGFHEFKLDGGADPCVIRATQCTKLYISAIPLKGVTKVAAYSDDTSSIQLAGLLLADVLPGDYSLEINSESVDGVILENFSGSANAPIKVISTTDSANGALLSGDNSGFGGQISATSAKLALANKKALGAATDIYLNDGSTIETTVPVTTSAHIHCTGTNNLLRLGNGNLTHTGQITTPAPDVPLFIVGKNNACSLLFSGDGNLNGLLALGTGEEGPGYTTMTGDQSAAGYIRLEVPGSQHTVGSAGLKLLNLTGVKGGLVTMNGDLELKLIQLPGGFPSSCPSNFVGAGNLILTPQTGSSPIYSLKGGLNAAYSGIITVNRIGNDKVKLIGDSRSLVGDIFNYGITDFSQAFDGDYYGDLKNTGHVLWGELWKNDIGSLRVWGDIEQRYVEVMEGALYVNGSLTITTNPASPGVVADSGTILGGTGLITGNVDNFGIIAPGTPGSPLSVTGPVTFEESSRYRAAMNGLFADRLDVDGDLNINTVDSTLQLIMTLPIRNFTYTLATTTAVTEPNMFTTVDIPPAFQYTLGFVPVASWDLLFTLTGISLSPYINASSGNALLTAQYLESEWPELDPFGGLYGVVNKLGNLSDLNDFGALTDALNQLQPALFSAFSLAQEDIAIRSRTLYSERANELFYTSCGCRAPHCYCHGMWLDVMGDYITQKPCEDQLGYNQKSGYTFIGYDWFMCSDLNAGLSLGYTRTSIDWMDVESRGTMDSYTAALYGSGCFCSTLVDASLEATYSSIDATRHIEFLDYNATNDHGSWLWAAHLGLSQYYDCSYVSFVPFAYLDCVDVHEDHFEEEGADAVSLIVGNHRANMLRGELGLRLLDDFCYCGTRLIPSLSASVVQEWRYAGTVFNSHMAGASSPDTFEVNGLNPDRTLFSPGAEVLLLGCEDALTLTLRYEGEFGKRVFENVGLVKLSYNY